MTFFKNTPVPETIFIVSKFTDSKAVREHFHSWRDVCYWAIDERPINRLAHQWYADLTWDEQKKFTLVEYAKDKMEELLKECGYELEKFKTADCKHRSIADGSCEDCGKEFDDEEIEERGLTGRTSLSKVCGD